MNEPAHRPATYDDLLALPDNVIGEILNGTLHAQPRPSPRHAAASTELSAVLGNEFSFRFGGSAGWRLLNELMLHLGADVIVPDIAGWGHPRLATLSETAWIERAPDWVCQVMSGSTARNDRVLKQAIYAHEGATHLWFVDPQARTVEVFALDDGRWVLAFAAGDDATVHLPPIETLGFSLGRLCG